MIFEFTEFTIATLLMNFAMFMFIIMVGLTHRDASPGKQVVYWMFCLAFLVVYFIPIGMDQYQVNRAYDFSIPSDMLSEEELTYRQEKLESQKELQNRADHVDKLINKQKEE